MSDFLAIAAVTETIRLLLDKAFDLEMSGASATAIRPDKGATSGDTTTNVYLYRVSPNPAFRGSDLPTRRPDGAFQQRPAIGLDLHYLLTFFGNDEELEPQRMMGIAVRTLHAFPVLTRNMIGAALASTPRAVLRNSDLAEQPELVKLTPAAMSLDELTKLWSVFFQTPYALSMAYEATMVCLEQDETISTPLPVRTRNLRVSPFAQPVISSIESDQGRNEPIVVGSTLRILGEFLAGDDTSVRLAGKLRSTEFVSSGEVTMRLQESIVPVAELRAGVQGLQIVQHVRFSAHSKPHQGSESLMAPFILQPTITNSAPVANGVKITVTPPVRVGQRAILVLEELSTDNPPAAVIPLPPATADTGTLTFAVPNLTAGTYFVRLQVDGAESPVDRDSASPTFGPRVTVP